MRERAVERRTGQTEREASSTAWRWRERLSLAARTREVGAPRVVEPSLLYIASIYRHEIGGRG